MDLEEMKRIKREHGLTYEMIAKESGVPLATVQKVFAGISRSPRYSTVSALESMFRQLDTRSIEEDYYMIPDEYRVELIEGKIHKLNTPSTVHQVIIGELFLDFRNYIRSGKDGCVPLVSPYNVELETGKDTVVQPDLMIICEERRKNIKRGHMYGAPDLVIEVLSTSTKRFDMLEKLHVYQISGVREYWIIDPYDKRVLVYDFQSEVTPAIYGFRDKVPVGIYSGDLVIDFGELDDYLHEVCGDMRENENEDEEQI